MEYLWQSILTGAIGLMLWVIRSNSVEVGRLNILINRTREELAKEYVTKAESNADMERIINRLEALDNKLDRLMER
jgi:archaellum component FlaC